MRMTLSFLPLIMTACLAGCSADAEDSEATEGAATASSALDFSKVLVKDALPTGKPATTPLTQAEALEDVRFFEFFMKYAHASRPFLQSNAHYDVEAAFDAVERAIMARPTWTVGELFDVLRPLALDIPDAHASLYLPGSTAAGYLAHGGRHFDAYVFADRTATVDAATCQVPAQARLLPEQSFLSVAGNVKLPIFLSRDALTEITCGGVAIRLEPLRPSGRALPNAFSERAIDADTYYIRLHTFAPNQTEVARSFIASADNARAYKTVILDLRGNGGGNPDFFLTWLQRLGAKGSVSVSRLNHTEGFAADVLWHNFFQGSLLGGHLDEPTRARFTEMLAPIKVRLDQDLATGNTERFQPAALDTADFEASLPGRFEGRVELLVDAKCASACEMSSFFAKKLPNFSVLSEANTMGATMAGEPAPFAMPNSSITAIIPTAILSHPESRDVDGVGVVPDIWVEPAAMGALFP
jgi:hypothetical protein